MYYFVRITPANVVYAFWLSLRAPVAAWRLKVPAWLARRFHRVRPYELWSRDEWLLAHDAAFDLWKQQAFPILSKRHRATFSIGRGRVDFSRNLWQMLGIELEALALFATLLDRAQTSGMRRVVEPWIARAFEPQELARLFPGISIVDSRVNRWLESIYEWGLSFAHLGRTFAHALSSLGRPRQRAGQRSTVWLGISGAEIPDRDDRLNFAWASQYGTIDKDDVLYFLPGALTPEQRSYLEARGISYVEAHRIFDLLGFTECARVVGRSVRGFLSALFGDSTAGAHVARFMARAPYWEALFRKVNAKAYITSTSYAWPEKAEAAVAVACGMRSVIWAYSANSLTFAVMSPEFRDVGVLRSIPVAREFWVWNTAYAEWLKKRQVEAVTDAFDVRIAGTLMCGDSRLLECDGAEARRRLGMPPSGTCVAVFDMAPMNDLWRDTFGGGPPMIDMASYVAFWEMIERILLRVAGSFALLKLKRELVHPYRVVPETLERLLNPAGDHAKAGRVVVVDVHVDPYLPVAACDVAFGVPYTSPVVAAHAMGKPAFFLDPTRRANWPSHHEYRRMCIVDDDQAEAVVAAAARGQLIRAHDVDSITPPRPSFPLHAQATRGTPVWIAPSTTEKSLTGT